jgi:hypothetical protein
MARYRILLLLALVMSLSGLGAAAQAQQYAQLLRDGEQATLSVFGPRAVDVAAKTLVNEFHVAISVEDLVDMTEANLGSSAGQALTPMTALLEIRLDLRPNGSLRDIRQVLTDLVETANAQLPFGYRVDRDGDTFTLVATRTRDEHGRLVDVTPLLDHHISIPFGTRRFYEHINLWRQAVKTQTGFDIACCSASAESQPGPLIAFQADDEPARSAFLRLVRGRPARTRLIRTERGAYQLVPSDPGGYRWTMRCPPAPSSCFMTLIPIPDKRP